MSIGNFALRNSVSINTLRVSLALLGIYMLFSLPREQYPNVPLYYVHIVVAYPGATAYEVEKDVTQKIEDELQGISDVNDITSTASNGLNFTRLEFSQSLSDEEFQNRYQEVQALISNISDLPEQAHDPEVENFTYLDFLPIVNVIVSADLPFAELMEYAARVETKLKTTPGVLKVENKGLLKKRVLVQPDIVTMGARGIAVQEIESAIRKWNMSIPGGTLHSENQSYNIRMSSDIATPQDVGNIILRSGENTFTTIADVARVFEDYDMTEQRVRFNGKSAVEFRLYKTGTADSISMVDEAKKRVAELSEKFQNEGENIHLSFFSDTTENINNTINILVSNAVLGFILLFLSLLIFLGWRSAVISALEIPFTFATSFFVLKLLGITLNSSTLFALVLVLGMIVDHSIVILENIIRLRHSHGKSRKAAVIEGVSDVAFPIVTSTLTTIGTFLPLAFMPGFIGKFLLPVPVTITVTLVISTVSALIIIPIHYLEMPGRDRTHDFAIFDYARNILQYTLERILRFKVLVSLGVLVVVVGVVFMLLFVPVSLYDTEDQPFFFVDVTMPSGTSIERSYRIMHEMEQGILSIKDENSITGVLMLIGNTDPDLAEGIRIDRPHNAQFQIGVENPNSNPNATPIDEIMDAVRGIIAPIAGANSVRIRKQRTGPPVDPAIGYQLVSDDLNALAALDASIRRRLTQYDELYNIKSNFQSKIPSLSITIDSQKASRYNLSFDYIGSTIRSLFANDGVSSIFVDNEQTNIVVSRGNDTSEAKNFLAFLTFPTERGTIVPLSAFATIEEQRDFTSIYRKDGRRQVNISAEASKRDRVRDIHDDMLLFAKEEIAALGVPVEFTIGGEFSQFSNLLNDIIRLFLISIVLVYFVLTVEFKSYFQPFLIMCTVIFTTIGVGAYLLISGTALSISILYSFVALVGVVVNNAIVLISTANDNVAHQHMAHHNAIIVAAKQRFKPIVLTSFTTVVGLLPTALGLSGKSPIWQPMASTIVTGLFFSTITTLLVLPALYELFSFDHKLKNKSHKTDASVYDGASVDHVKKSNNHNPVVLHEQNDHVDIKSTVPKKRKKNSKKPSKKLAMHNNKTKHVCSYAEKKQGIDEVVSALINTPRVQQSSRVLHFNATASTHHTEERET